MTEYVILRQDDDGRWEDVGRTSQRSARAAIKIALDPDRTVGAPIPPGVLVAVPARSWQPTPVTAVTKTTLQFS